MPERARRLEKEGRWLSKTCVFGSRVGKEPRGETVVFGSDTRHVDSVCFYGGVWLFFGGHRRMIS